jgi:hypothetical protein
MKTRLLVLAALSVALGACTGGDHAGHGRAFRPYLALSRHTAVEDIAIVGSIHATTAHSFLGSGHSCSLRGDTLTYLSDAMAIAGSSHVVRLHIELSSFGHSGPYSATQPLEEYRRTPVTVSVSPNAASGTGWFYIASGGQVHVGAIGSGGWAKGTFGTVDANLALQEGHRSIRVRGTWAC